MRDGMLILIVLGVVVAFIVVGTVLIALAWSWVVPDVFSGAVQQNILPTKLTVWQAFKLAVLLAVLGLTNRVTASKS